MKKLSFLLAFSLTALALAAQSLPKKYVLLEHFTNSRCSICASRNPGFFTLINQYPDDVHHISVHPSVPYNNCLLYLANTTQNNARAAAYGVNGTPRVALNGTLVPGGSQLLPAATLQAALGQQSPIAIEVLESGAAPTKTATVTVRTFGDVPAGNYKLFAAVAESTVNYASPNGEQKHHNVFRAMLTNIDGDAITLPATGESASFNFSYTFTAPNGWTSNYDSLFVLAFVQNTATKEVLNSGTRFDAVFTSAREAAAPQSVRIQPNPATEEASVLLPGEQVARVEVFSIGGNLMQTVYNTQADLVRIPVAALAPGIYFVKITGKNGIYIGKMVKSNG
ncbi:MAG: Omp28-related outer membrane protein [Lewinellaceae bacterium]|nr:Omp28-related outer membrane protein [Lewinellaceae bacterium]